MLTTLVGHGKLPGVNLVDGMLVWLRANTVELDTEIVGKVINTSITMAFLLARNKTGVSHSRSARSVC